MVFRQERHIFIATFLILLMGFFSTTSSLQNSLSSEQSTETADTLSFEQSSETTDTFSFEQSPEVTGQVVSDATSGTTPLGEGIIGIREEYETLRPNYLDCPKRVELFSRLVDAYIDFERSRMVVVRRPDPSLWPDIQNEQLQKEFYILMRKMISDYFAYCRDDPNGNKIIEPYNKALKLTKIRRYDKINEFPQFNPSSQDNLFTNLDTCYTPLTEVPLPVDHVEEILLGLGLFALSLTGAGVIVLAVRTIKCGTIVAEAAGAGARIYSIYGRAAPIIPIASVTARTAILSTSTVAAVTPTIASAVARGVAPTAIVFALGDATDRLNAQNTGPLKILSEDQANAVINGLTSSDNQRFKDRTQVACTQKRKICPITPGGSLPEKILDPSDPSFTSTEPGNTCAGSQSPAQPHIIGERTGDHYKVSIFMDPSPAFLQGDPNFQGPPAPGSEGLGIIDFVVLDSNAQDVTRLVTLEGSLVNNDAELDFSDLCRNYPPGTTYYMTTRWKFFSNRCPMYVEVTNSFTCNTQATPQIGALVTYTTRPPQLSPAQLHNFLLQLGIALGSSSGPITPAPVYCSGNLCRTPSSNSACPPDQYCTSACVCAPLHCGDGIITSTPPQNEVCDTGIMPNGGCNANEQCVNTCRRCQSNRRVITPSGGVITPLRGSGGESRDGGDDISGAAVTISDSEFTEQWTLRSGRPTDLVAVDYSNNRRETASATMKRTLEPVRVTHTDGTTTTYIYDSANKLQSLSNTKGFRETYTYDARGLLSQIDTRDPVLDIRKTTFTPFTLPANYPSSNRYEGVRTYETFLFSQKQKPLFMGTFLRPNTHIPRLNVVPPYSTYVITRTVSAGGTTDTFTIVANPDTQRYTVSTTDVYTSDFKLQSTTYTVDYTGDGIAERTLTQIFNYDDANKQLNSVTEQHTAPIGTYQQDYTAHYSAAIPGVEGSQSFLKFTNPNGEDVTRRTNGIYAVF